MLHTMSPAQHWEHVNEETAFCRKCQGLPLYRTTSTPLTVHNAVNILTIGTTFLCVFSLISRRIYENLFLKFHSMYPSFFKQPYFLSQFEEGFHAEMEELTMTHLRSLMYFGLLGLTFIK